MRVSLVGWTRASAGLGMTAIACSLVALALGRQEFWRGYLVALVFWTQVAVGSLGILMLQHVTGGAWGRAIRGLLEAATRTLPLVALLFVPIFVGLGDLYEWARPGHADALLAHKAAWLNAPSFLVRAATYWLLWLVTAALLNRWSAARTQTGAADAVAHVAVDRSRQRALSSVGLVVWTLTVTFASIDWVMSLEPHWVSTMYPVLFIAGELLTAFAFATVAAAGDRTGLSPRVRNDLGKLLFAFVMLWAYAAFSQYLIVWSGNLPEEIPFYLRRLAPGWRGVGIAIVLLHFALPFALLLPRAANRDPRLLVAAALLLLAMRFVDTLWMVVPGSSHAGASLGWLDFALPLGVGGLWVATFLRALGRRAAKPDQLQEVPKQQ